MFNTITEKKQIKKIADEDLKLLEINQLHVAVSEFSKKSLEIKKLMATLLLGIATITIQINKNRIDGKVYIIILITIAIFWIIDADSYYFQEKLRRRMKVLMNEIRNGRGLINENGVGMEISESRKDVEKDMRFRSFINSSQKIYIILSILTIIVWSSQLILEKLWICNG